MEGYLLPEEGGKEGADQVAGSGGGGEGDEAIMPTVCMYPGPPIYGIRTRIDTVLYILRWKNKSHENKLQYTSDTQ
jgi:hypothetical protein